MLKLTEQAAAQIRTNLDAQDLQGMCLRIAARTLPDGSIDYGLGFDEPREEDVKVVSQGVELLVNRSMQPLLEGAVIDYVELEPEQFHFIFLNPNDPNYVPPATEDGETSKD